MKGCSTMEEMQVVYKGEFTIEQRKAMTAQALREFRKLNKLSQKEVAAHLNIPATTYNTYESGRTEPPIEILVRLSYLYNVPVDFIVQRDRVYKTADDVAQMLADYKEQLTAYDQQLDEKGVEAPGVREFMDSMKKLTEALTAYSQTEAAQKAINKPVQD